MARDNLDTDVPDTHAHDGDASNRGANSRGANDAGDADLHHRDTTTADPTVADAAPASEVSPWPIRLLAIASGVALMMSLPPWGWWPLAFAGIAGIDRVVAASARRGQRLRHTWLAAAAWLFPSTIWMFDFTAPGYVVAMVVFSALYGIVGGLAPQGRGRRPVLAGGFVFAELIRASWPFGGVPISTMAMMLSSSPLLPIARVGGPFLLAFTIMTIGLTLSAAVGRQTRTAILGVAGALILILLGLVGPRGETIDTLDVAVVQGGGPQRTRASASQEPIVFARHLEASQTISTPVDLVLWPENVVNPKAPGASENAAGLDKDFAQTELEQLARDLDAPILPGWFEKVSDTNTINYTNIINPDGSTGDRYDKVRLVPFGEVIPFRPLLESIAGDALPARDVIPGTEPAVLDTPVGTLGISISWEIFFANRARDAVGNGGEVLINPTNGSSYWLTIVQSQQIASSKLRAMETGRWVLQAAPTGFSAVITPEGKVVDRTGVSETRVLTETIERRRGLTWANRVGNWPAVLLALAGIVGGLAASERRATRTTGTDRTAAASKAEVPDREGRPAVP